MPHRRQSSRRPHSEAHALVLQWSGLPAHIYRRYSPLNPYLRQLGADDAIAAGFVGLVKASQLWDKTRGVQFQTYAYRAVLQHMNEAANCAPVIRGPKCRSMKERKKYESLNPVPTVLGESVLDGSGQGSAIAAVAVDDRDHEREVDLRLDVEQVLDLANSRDKTILRLYYFDRLTYEKIGKRLGVTKERVRQLLRKAEERIRGRFAVGQVRRQLAER